MELTGLRLGSGEQRGVDPTVEKGEASVGNHAHQQGGGLRLHQRASARRVPQRQRPSRRRGEREPREQARRKVAVRREPRVAWLAALVGERGRRLVRVLAVQRGQRLAERVPVLQQHRQPVRSPVAEHVPGGLTVQPDPAVRSSDWVSMYLGSDPVCADDVRGDRRGGSNGDARRMHDAVHVGPGTRFDDARRARAKGARLRLARSFLERIRELQALPKLEPQRLQEALPCARW